jgi:hypothetical protein
MIGVVKVVPVPNAEPPVEAAYQLIVPEEAVAPKFTVPAPQRAAGTVVVTVGILFTVTRTCVLADVQVLLVASTQ